MCKASRFAMHIAFTCDAPCHTNKAQYVSRIHHKHKTHAHAEAPKRQAKTGKVSSFKSRNRVSNATATRHAVFRPLRPHSRYSYICTLWKRAWVCMPRRVVVNSAETSVHGKLLQNAPCQPLLGPGPAVYERCGPGGGGWRSSP